MQFQLWATMQSEPVPFFQLFETHCSVPLVYYRIRHFTETFIVGLLANVVFAKRSQAYNDLEAPQKRSTHSTKDSDGGRHDLLCVALLSYVDCMPHYYKPHWLRHWRCFCSTIVNTTSVSVTVLTLRFEPC